jgi:hypothetical protein
MTELLGLVYCVYGYICNLWLSIMVKSVNNSYTKGDKVNQ